MITSLVVKIVWIHGYLMVIETMKFVIFIMVDPDQDRGGVLEDRHIKIHK